MKLYKEVLIESVEQADQLPDGTVAVRDGHWPRILLCDDTGQHWAAGDTGPMLTPDMTGWTALVPIEAEEEVWLAGPDKPIVNGQRIDKTAHRWCTPWEEA